MKKIIIALSTLILAFVILFTLKNYHRDVVMEKDDYKIIEIVSYKGEFGVATMRYEPKIFRCFSFENHRNYKVIINGYIDNEQDLVGKHITYKKIGNKIFYREEIEFQGRLS
jgi:hypothetical protein